jgi:hypothetical protein
MPNLVVLAFEVSHAVLEEKKNRDILLGFSENRPFGRP